MGTSSPEPQTQQQPQGPSPAEVGAGTAVAVQAPTLAPGVAAASVMAALLRWLGELDTQHARWLATNLGRPGLPFEQVAHIAQGEMELEREFARNSANRVAATLPAVLAIGPPGERAEAMRRMLEREREFADSRAEAMAVRAIGAVGRIQLRRDSPLGAFWRLGSAEKHTLGCLAMAGRFWPWAVLDRVHPPRHYGCTSSLWSFGHAVKSGWMSAADVPDTRAAIAKAAGVVMEQEEADALERELVVREQLAEQGVDTSLVPWAGLSEAFEEGKHPRGWHGRWMKVAAVKNFSYNDLDKRLKEWLAPAQLDASREKHPRSGYEVKVGHELRVAPPADGKSEGPAVFNVTDHGQVTDKGLRFPKVVGQQPITHVYRGVSEAEWKQAVERGFVQSDQRGTLAEWEGTNADVDPGSAVSYLPVNGRGRVLKIRVDPADGWFTRREDGYLRTRQRIPLERVEAVSPVLAKDERTHLSLVASRRLAPPTSAGASAATAFDPERGSKAPTLRSAISTDVRRALGEGYERDFPNRLDLLDAIEADSPIEVFRVTDEGTPIGPGDYVTESKEYASGMRAARGGKIATARVRPSRLALTVSAGLIVPHEFFYRKEEVKG